MGFNSAVKVLMFYFQTNYAFLPFVLSFYSHVLSFSVLLSLRLWFIFPQHNTTLPKAFLFPPAKVITYSLLFNIPIIEAKLFRV